MECIRSIIETICIYFNVSLLQLIVMESMVFIAMFSGIDNVSINIDNVSIWIEYVSVNIDSGSINDIFISIFNEINGDGINCIYHNIQLMVY